MKWILLLCLFLPFDAAKAQGTNASYKLSGPEDVAIAFYKTGGKLPPFETWIRKQEPYTSTAPFLRPRVLAEQKTRLRAAYDAFDPRSDVLTLGARAGALVHLAPPDAANPQGRPELHFDLAIGNPPSFPYAYMDNDFVLIPSDPEGVLKQPITVERYNYLARALETQTAPLTLIFQMRPLRAEMDKPLRAGGKIQWPLITEMASMSLWNENGALLWEHTMVTSIAPENNELLNLRQNYRQNSP